MISVESPWNAFAKVSCKYRKRKNTVGIQREVGSLSVYLKVLDFQFSALTSAC